MRSTQRRLLLSLGWALWLVAGGAGADELGLGAPLLQFHGNSIETTSLEIPFCGVACDFLDPTFVNHQMTLGADGFMTWVTVRNPLGDDARGSSTLVAGEGRPDLLRALTRRLQQARIGFAEGGCFVYYSEAFFTDDGVLGHHSQVLDGQLIWYGRGDRYRVIELPATADTLPCPQEMQRLIQLLFELRSQIRE
jgi:hypothetical protein